MSNTFRKRLALFHLFKRPNPFIWKLCKTPFLILSWPFSPFFLKTGKWNQFFYILTKKSDQNNICFQATIKVPTKKVFYLKWLRGIPKQLTLVRCLARNPAQLRTADSILRAIAVAYTTGISTSGTRRLEEERKKTFVFLVDCRYSNSYIICILLWKLGP